jgi:hypothetical protein
MKKQQSNRLLKETKSAKMLNEAARLTMLGVHKSKVKKKKVRRAKGQRGPTVHGDSQMTEQRLRALIHPELTAYLASVANPWNQARVFCPVNYNPVPSFVTQYGRTTSCEVEYAVPAGFSANLVLFPGHGNLNANTFAAATGNNAVLGYADFDEVAYHSLPQNFGDGFYVVGPCVTLDAAGDTLQPVCGGIAPNLASGTVGGGTTAFNSLQYDAALPYQMSTNAPGHSRWKLTSMGIRIQNVTPELTRGGSIISYQPINNVPQNGGTAVTTFARLPTFKDWGSDGCEITWIPRMRDMAFWHLSSTQQPNGSATNTLINVPAISIVLTSPGAQIQTYDWQIVCNWELAGDLFATVGSRAVHAPELKPVVERVHSELVNTAATAHAALTVGRKMANEVRKGASMAVGAIGAVSTVAAGFA